MESWTDDIEQQLKQDLQAFLIRFFSYVTHTHTHTVLVVRVFGVRLTHSQHLQQVSAACVLCVPAA
jgi:hypothetical protein